MVLWLAEAEGEPGTLEHEGHQGPKGTTLACLAFARCWIASGLREPEYPDD